VLEKHPRLLVGTQVPAIGKEGMETLRDAQDAEQWQEAVKSLLVAEVRDRASKEMDESADFMAMMHASIELFQNNADLIPGTTGFDKELADRFVTFAAPYEVRVDEKLMGYSIPVQPIIEQLRGQLVAERKAGEAGESAASAPAAQGAASPAPPAATKKPPDPPQEGVTSKSGSSSDKEDFSTLFGTIGLPDLQI
jgi:hypothetical protein